MDIGISVLFGIMAMIGWGVADFLGKLGVDEIGTYHTVTIVTGISMTFLLLFATPLAELNAFYIGLFIFLGILWALSGMAFYKGLEVGKVSVISPLASSWGALAVILSLVFFNETIAGMQIGGIMLAFLGVVMVTTSWKELSKTKITKLVKGAEYGIAALVMWAIILTTVKITIPIYGAIMPIIIIKFVALVIMIGYSPIKKIKWDIPWRKLWKLFIAIGIFDAMAFVGYNYGIAQGSISVVAPIAAAFPAITIVLARIFLKEKLERSQQLGVVAILAGLVLLSI